MLPKLQRFRIKKINGQTKMFTFYTRKFERLENCEQAAFMLLLPAVVLNLTASISRTWFELPGIAAYGLWTSEYRDTVLERNHLIAAFFTKEPMEYHILQTIFLLSWMALLVSIWLMFSEKAMMRVPRFLRKSRQHAIAAFCFISAFTLNSGLYLFYHILRGLPPDPNIYPVMKWGGQVSSLACVMQLVAGMLLM